MTDIVSRLREADISGHGTYSALVRDAAAEIERLRAALKPFAEVGRQFVELCETGAFPSGASARYLKLEPLVAGDFVRAATTLSDVEQTSCRPTES